ncbi:MAG: O-antigen ligase family protein [Deltaproteobacteria bacterium]|nr:O-antigen ligase family protein [Deltaproteobacteria bacterium]
MSRVHLLISRLAFAVILLLVAAVPLVFCHAFDNAFRETKFITIWTLSAVLGLAFAASGTLRLPKMVLLALGIHAALMTQSLIGAVHPGRGLSYLMEQLSMLVLLPAGASFVSSPRRRGLLLATLLLAADAVLLIGVAQLEGRDPVGTGLVSGLPVSTLGFKNLAAQVYLLAGVLAASQLILTPRSYWPAAFLATTFFLMLLGVWLMRSRSAFLGLVVGLATVVIVARWRRGRASTMRRLLMPTATGLVIAGAVTLVSVRAQEGPRSFARPPPWQTVEATATLNTRLIRWHNSLRMVLDHPVRGVGLGNFRVHYPRYGVDDPEQTGSRNVHEAHNEFLQVLAETGAVGLAGFLALLIVVARALHGAALRAETEPEQRDLSLSCLGMLAGILTQTVFSFALRNPTPPVWLWTCCGAALSAPAVSRMTRLRSGVRLVACVLLAALFAAYASVSAKASQMTAAGAAALGQGRLEDARALFERASLHPNADRALLNLCYVEGRLGRRAAAVSACRRALARQPNNHIIHDQLARQLQSAGLYQEALFHYERALTTDPELTRARIERDKLLKLLSK